MRSSKKIVTTLAILLALHGTPAISDTISLSKPLEAELTGLMNQGLISEARELLAENPHEEADKLLFEGRVYKLSGDLDKAVDFLDKALRLRPSDIVIRRELAHTLFLAQRYSRAQAHLQKLVRQDGDPLLRQSYLSMMNTIRNKRPGSFGLTLALEPSTNIVNGSSSDEFYTPTTSIRIDDASRETSGIGLTAILVGKYSVLRRANTNIEFDIGISATRYSVEQANGKENLNFGISYRFEDEFSKISIRPNWHQTETDSLPRETGFGVELDWRKRLTSDSDIQTRVSTEYVEVSGQPDRNGLKTNLHLSYQKLLSQRTALTFGAALERNSSGLAHNQYRGGLLHLSLGYVFPSGVVSHARIAFGRRKFDEDFPLLSHERADDYAELSIQLRNAKWNIWGFSPVATCKHTSNQSNIDLYTYKTTSCAASLTKEF